MKLKTPTFPRKSHHEPAPVNPATPPVVPTGSGPAPRSLTTPSAPAAPLRKAAGGLTAPTRQRNAAVMIAGVVFILIAAAIGASVAAAFDDSIDVLVAAEDIAEGEQIQAGDFRVVQIAASAGAIEALDPNAVDELVGRVAAGPIGEGSLIHPDQFADAAQEQRIVVGASLGPNQFPASGLRPGDEVRIISIAGRSSFGSSDSGVTQEIAVGEITHVTDAGSSGIHVSMRIPESSSNLVVQLIAQNRISLGLVDQSISVDLVTPLTAEDPVSPLTLEPAE